MKTKAKQVLIAKAIGMIEQNKNSAAASPAKNPATAQDAEQVVKAGPCCADDTTKMSWAETKFSQMGIGRKHAVYVKTNDAYDRDYRAFKRLIAEARKRGILVIAGAHAGLPGWYWIADIDDPRDVKLMDHQVFSMLHRAREIEAAAYAMADTVGLTGRP